MGVWGGVGPAWWWGGGGAGGGGGSSCMMGIISFPLFGIGLTDLSKSGGAIVPPSLVSYRPVFVSKTLENGI